MQLKQEMMDEIFNVEPDTTRAMQIPDLIGKKQTEVERITFNHFLDLKERAWFQLRPIINNTAFSCLNRTK